MSAATAQIIKSFWQQRWKKSPRYSI